MKSLFTTITVLALCSSLPGPAFAQGTNAFTYQGQLRDGGTNANGTYTMTFKLYDAASGGNQIGDTINRSPGLANGLFSVDLDFGAGAFGGGARWLDITVNTNWFLLRQQIMPTPYALYADTAGKAETVTNGAVQDPSFLGTTGATPLDIVVNSVRALRFEPTVRTVTNIVGIDITVFSSTFVNVIGGFSGNIVSNGFVSSTIAGGGAAEVAEIEDHVPSPNIIGANYATIGGGVRNKVTGIGGLVSGGFGNLASGDTATVAGGFGNTASAAGAVVAGGEENLASGEMATVAGGHSNVASSEDGFVGGGQSNAVNSQGGFIGGGESNVVNGTFAMVPGGFNNEAGGNSSFAAGKNAHAVHEGAFVWSDTSPGTFSSTTNNQFSVRADGGVRLNTGNSGATVNGREITTGLERLHIVRGSVTQNGSIFKGTGFSVSHPSSGKYVVTFSQSFSVSPVITLTAYQQPTNGFRANVAGLAYNADDHRSVFTVVTPQTDENGTLTDAAFEFIAIGIP